jgi:mono/diheme cytochrome c family protein
MNKQRNMLLEMTVFAAFIFCLCYLLWNVNFYPHKKTGKVTAPDYASTLQDEKLEKGRLLFRSYCNSCHYPYANGLGPPLAGARKRWENAGSYQGKNGDQWLKAWIRNWKDVVAAGYPYGVMMAKSRENEMNYFINLTDEQIDLILNYVDSVPQVASDNGLHK